ncbi:MAG: hypothetical protein COT24_04025 [Candidatus Kerfeldbacteria bacterium CG08_land_8_20_14_0_20_40_16]|uniref:Uncharacterized protein n=1 Tax=Candidatus Kerfeldbacteria bacterium CG08_land_8_20_14_0_20_40_16 TaxID=2014244 RepID=A0A2H0YXA1_9BACT|nr:MAG: hypothetical protein COT24_04025 [Candidatus Kerfeldbacteria bacterium CG08_land_8_20_14_0_20_40_16]
MFVVMIVVLMVSAAIVMTFLLIGKAATPSQRRTAAETSPTDVTQNPNWLSRRWKRIRGNKPFKEWMRTWGTFGCWVSFWAAEIILVEVNNPGFWKKLLFGWDFMTVGFWVMHVIFIWTLGTWGSGKSKGARKFSVLLCNVVWIGLFVFFQSQILNIPYSDWLFRNVLKNSNQSATTQTYTTPANYENYIASPAPGMIIAGVVPEGKAPDGSWKLQYVCDLKPGENLITITEVNGRIRANGRYTRFESEKLYADVVRGPRDWESIEISDEESPLRLAVGNRLVLIAGPGEVRMTVTKLTPLYAYIEAEQGGSGIVQLKLTVRSS